MAARSDGFLAVVGTGRHRLGGREETGGGDNDDIGVRTGGGGRYGIKRGIGRRGRISWSKWVEWSVMEWGRRVIHLDIRRAGNTTGWGRCSSKNLNIKRDIV